MSPLNERKETREPWQIAIDKDIERKEKLRKEKEEAKRISDEKKAQEEHQRKVQELGEKFKCHCCGKSSRVPLNVNYSDDYGGGTFTRWDEPGDLERCLHCGQFTCKSCLYKGICKTCALKMVSKH